MSVGIKVEVPAKVTEEAASFLMRVLGPMAEASDLLTDKIRYFRWKAAVKAISQAQEFAREHGLDPKTIPLKQLVPLIEGASLEDDESELVEKWAALIARATDSPSHNYVFFAKILSSLDTGEAQLLDRLWLSTSERHIFHITSIEPEPGIPDRVRHAVTAICQSLEDGRTPPSVRPELNNLEIYFWRERDVSNFQELNFGGDDKIIYLQHLVSLELVRTYFQTDLVHHLVDGRPSSRNQERVFFASVELTPLGYEFVTACNPPRE